MLDREAVRHRYWRWFRELDAYGYVDIAAAQKAASPGEVALRARRPMTYGGPPATIDVYELWLPGTDPDGLGLEQQRRQHLHVSSWHAQILTTGAEGAERLDVDRRKPSPLLVHRHPFGSPNNVRLPAGHLVAPERWIAAVETLIHRHFA